MEEKEPTLKDLAHAIAENSRAIAETTQAVADTNDLLRGFIGYTEERFEKLDHQLEEFKQETADNFRQVHREIADLREETMPLAEQSEVRLRVHRIEEHLGLPHEVKPA